MVMPTYFCYTRRDALTPEQRSDLRDHLMAVTGAEERFVWVYVNELTPTDMIEFGHVLPAHGMEQEWFDALPSDLRAWLLTFGKPSPRFTL
jgi:hypothetical protein